jgi:oligoribonuclease (3'-5' exoribonuclease)
MGIIAFTDIEACGLDDDSPILEVAIILTTQKLTRIASAKWVIAHPNWPVLRERLEAEPDPIVFNMHTANGLIADLDALHASGEGKTISEVEAEIVAFIAQRNPGGKVTFGGSGVAQYDMRLFKRQMPTLHGLSNYYTYDISPVRRFAKVAGVVVPAEISDQASKTHRADDDVEMHLREADWFIRFLTQARQAGVMGLTPADPAKESIDVLVDALLADNLALDPGATPTERAEAMIERLTALVREFNGG